MNEWTFDPAGVGPSRRDKVWEMPLGLLLLPVSLHPCVMLPLGTLAEPALALTWPSWLSSGDSAVGTLAPSMGA